MLEIVPRETLQSLTGLKRQSAIKRFLDRQKIPYIMGADGWPKVLHAIIVERMGGRVIPPAPEPKLRLRNG